MIVFEIREDGELISSIEVPEKYWYPSKYETYEHTYVSGHITCSKRTGYSYNIWLERPIARASSVADIL